MDEKCSTSSGCLHAFVGAIIANVVVVAGAFGMGVIFGEPTIIAEDPMRPRQDGVAGGFLAVMFFLEISVFLAAIPQLVIGFVGAVIALAVRWIARLIERGRDRPKTGN